MVRASSIREKYRSKALQKLAKERGVKRGSGDSKPEHESDSDELDERRSTNDDEIDRLEQERRSKRARQTNNSLLSMLPKPKNSSSFGPTVKLDKLLTMPERADEHLFDPSELQNTKELVAEDGLLEVDVSKVIGDSTPNLIKDLTVEKNDADAIILPKGKEKQKNQITYLAQVAALNELRQKEKSAQGRMNQAAGRAKYGW